MQMSKLEPRTPLTAKRVCQINYEREMQTAATLLCDVMDKVYHAMGSVPKDSDAYKRGQMMVQDLSKISQVMQESVTEEFVWDNTK